MARLYRVDEGRTVTFGFAPSAVLSAAASAKSTNRLARMVEPAEWAAAGIPLLRNPREVVSGLHSRHLPTPSTAVIAVLDPDERLRASASFTRRPVPAADGWEFRNALLAQLRRIIPHDLRRRSPVRTAVLLYCRQGDEEWSEEDGAWMWGLRDACTLHGLRCGAYITLTHDGWQVLGEDRGGRYPNAESAVQQAPILDQAPIRDAPAASDSGRTRRPPRIAAPGGTRCSPRRASSTAPAAQADVATRTEVIAAVPVQTAPPAGTTYPVAGATPAVQATGAPAAPAAEGKPAVPRSSGGALWMLPSAAAR